jgi:3-isopropylmalate dehydratase small subunit
MMVTGRAVLVPGDDVDTDVLYPGPFLSVQDPALMASHLFEGLDPTLRDRLGGDTVLIVGSNFGCGSSREHVVQAMRASGVRCVLGRSFARIFHRNCLNLGLLALISPEAAAAATDGETVEVDTASGTVTLAGRPWAGRPVAPFLLDMVAAGGLVEYTRTSHPGALP